MTRADEPLPRADVTPQELRWRTAVPDAVGYWLRARRRFRKPGEVDLDLLCDSGPHQPPDLVQLPRFGE